jgi:hypothetical protein
MQIVRPDMLSFISGFLILVLAIVGLVGILILYNGIKSIKSQKSKSLPYVKMAFGCLCFAFVVYNLVGYYCIFHEKEKLIIGEYQCKSTKARMSTHTDYSWVMTSETDQIIAKGKWEYVMSEDWCYWNIKSEYKGYFTQTGSSETIKFEERNLIFKRINPRN